MYGTRYTTLCRLGRVGAGLWLFWAWLECRDRARCTCVVVAYHTTSHICYWYPEHNPCSSQTRS